MKAELKIKKWVIDAAREGGHELPEGDIEVVYSYLIENDLHWDYVEEFRCSGDDTRLDSEEYSRHYECKEVARKLPDGSWVGWTYWHGGGKYGEPEMIPWIEKAYNLSVHEEKKVVTVRTFKKASE